MTLPDWHEEAIEKAHRRHEFDCGDEELNRFLARYARQSHVRGAAKTFCAIDNADAGRILGFYTLTPTSIEFAETPSSLTRGLARHEIGGFRLARLATDLQVAGQGLGGQLLAAAALRCLRAARDVGGMLLVIDAKNERAAAWYERFGAQALLDQPLTLVMALDTFAQSFEAKGLLDR